MDSDHRIASRNFKTDSSGNVYVEYAGRDGIRLAFAHEIHRYGKYPLDMILYSHMKNP